MESQSVDEESLPPTRLTMVNENDCLVKVFGSNFGLYGKKRLKSALEAKNLQNMTCEANVENSENLRGGLNGQTTSSESRKLDFIYDNEPLRFEKDPFESNEKMQAQDPLEEADLGDRAVKRPTYINTKIEPDMKKEVVEMLKEFKDCFS